MEKCHLDFIFGKDIVIDGHYDIDMENKFIEKSQLVRQMVQEQLGKSQAKYKTRQDMKNIVLIIVSKLEMKFGFTLTKRGLKEKVKN